MTSDNRQTQEFFGAYADDFDAIYGKNQGWLQSLINRYLRKSMRLRFELSLANCSPIEGKTVLDVGCGPGHYSITLAKSGARNVLGIDFAPQMIELANQKARELNLEDRCSFQPADFFELVSSQQFDYVLLMGFMDYMKDAKAVVDKALSLARESCFFSFPASGGLLAWQRKLRYSKRCPIYLYSYQQIVDLFSGRQDILVTIKKIGRDYWVKADIQVPPDYPRIK